MSPTFKTFSIGLNGFHVACSHLDLLCFCQILQLKEQVQKHTERRAQAERDAVQQVSLCSHLFPLFRTIILDYDNAVHSSSNLHAELSLGKTLNIVCGLLRRVM